MKRHPALPYVAPFVVYLALMLAQRALPLPLRYMHAACFVLAGAVAVLGLRSTLPWRLARPGWSILCGIVAYGIWVAPDLLWSGYRGLPLFHNALTGAAVSSFPAPLREDSLFLVIRLMTSVLLVPVVEELFWRGWLMRRLVDARFQAVPLGAYTAEAFWMTAALFASEHGPYWDVGLAAGCIYNWWIMRTRSLADCTLAHAVTNLCLGVHVLALGQWQYWL